MDLLLFRRLLVICQRSREPSFWEVMFFFVILAYASSAISRTFATITSLPELNIRFRKFILFVQMKKVISMNYGSNTSS